MSTFHLTVSTPDGQLFDGEVQSLRLRMLDGDLGLLAGHENYVAGVGAGEALIVTEEATCCLYWRTAFHVGQSLFASAYNI